MPESPKNARRTSIHDLLAHARKTLHRLTPPEAVDAQRAGAVLIDTRSPDQRRAQGAVPGARCFPLSELEWWLDPDSGHADPHVELGDWIVLLCAEGYSSSL